MSVFLCVLVAPLGLLVILALAWFEDRIFRPRLRSRDQPARATVHLLKLDGSRPSPGNDAAAPAEPSVPSLQETDNAA